MDQTKYIRDLFVNEDDVLASIGSRLTSLGMPLISVPSEVGKWLTMMVRMTGAKKILEVGTLAGYSTICLVRGLNKDGHCTTIELKEEHAKLARYHFEEAGLQDCVTTLVGDASLQLAKLIQEEKKFDFIFLDADKVNYPTYLEQVIQLSLPGTVIVMDNLLLGGRVLDGEDQHPAPIAVRKVTKMLASHSHLESMLLPVGDGLGVAIVQ
ncbi:O-methyltransferase [Shimazuella sp. AN120528]|uniref:O-methyltransferase n=1 Tax=Shimazuella soli TaxID=1892854 RepID=UPI001F0DC9B0|nr:O-methyltransferase [Shimazuella soli]MCH5583904.1 O-methyltransferase [Shimazuella soli]